jgi:hypothetical protein
VKRKPWSVLVHFFYTQRGRRIDDRCDGFWSHTVERATVSELNVEELKAGKGRKGSSEATSVACLMKPVLCNSVQAALRTSATSLGSEQIVQLFMLKVVSGPVQPKSRLSCPSLLSIVFTQHRSSPRFWMRVEGVQPSPYLPSTLSPLSMLTSRSCASIAPLSVPVPSFNLHSYDSIRQP